MLSLVSLTIRPYVGIPNTQSKSTPFAEPLSLWAARSVDCHRHRFPSRQTNVVRKPGEALPDLSVIHQARDDWHARSGAC